MTRKTTDDKKQTATATATKTKNNVNRNSISNLNSQSNYTNINNSDVKNYMYHMGNGNKRDNQR